MATITITWTSYKSNFPRIIDKELYDYYKSNWDESHFKIRSGFLKEFWHYILSTAIAVFIIIGFYFDFIDDNWFFVILLFMSAGSIVTFSLSAVSYLNDFYLNKKYVKTIRKNLLSSLSYDDFCNKMSLTDLRYVMQLQRSNSNKQAH